MKFLSEYGATFATIHGNQALMEKAVENKGDLKILSFGLVFIQVRSFTCASGALCLTELMPT
jgi:hypothetical protein